MLLSGLLVTEDGIRSLKKLELYVEKPFRCRQDLSPRYSRYMSSNLLLSSSVSIV